MPRTRSLAWAELKFGLIAVFALVMAGLLIFAVGGTTGFFWQNYPLKVQFPNVAGLMSGSPVRVAGVEVGSVTNVELVPNGAEVWFNIVDEMRPVVTDRSTAKIGSISLLGEGAVDIEAGPGGTPIPDWGYVRTGKPAASIADLTEQAGTGISDVTAMLADLRAGKGTIGKLLTDESLYSDFNSLLGAADRVTKNIANGKGTMGKLANDPKVYDELNASVANLNAITAKLRRGEGSLGQLLNDPTLAKSLNTTTNNLEGVTGRLNRGEGTAGKLLTDDALYKRMDSLTARLDTVLQNLNSGEGTAGQLLHDKQLYENMNQTVGEMRALITEIKKDPKKYLNVKVSIF
ncbi:MAG TPA: MlaD family protein [Vicinamibacterales bacterium]|nr:MlaD family protein [Vicinamibacterales bacterium]